MLETIKNMSVVEFANWWQRANGHRHEQDSYWIQKQREVVFFLEEVRKHASS